MNDTTRRFLSAITERVPEGGRIVELRLFPAIRQGGIESGVAVVAVEAPIPTADDAASVEGDAGDEAESGASSALAHDAPQSESSAAKQHDDDGDDAAQLQGERVVPHVHEGIADDPSTAAALSLVDTDIAPEDEEGTVGDEAEESTTYIPSAGVSDDDDVADALDDEMTTIVVNADREIRRAEMRDEVASTLEATIDGDHPSESDDVTSRLDSTEGSAEAVLEGTVPPSESALAEGSAVPSSDDDVESEEDSPYADAPPPPDAPHRELLADVADGPDDDPDAMRLDDILALPSPDNSADADDAAEPEEAVAPPRAIQRYAILTASYRLTIKGPDRGKWDVDLTHEADAPLATVERVARGVSKRSGDGSEPEHFSGESLKQALDAPAWIETT